MVWFGFRKNKIKTNTILTNENPSQNLSSSIIEYEKALKNIFQIDSLAQMCKQELVSVLSTKKLSNFEEIVDHILKGNVAILADGENSALLADVSKFDTRAIEEPFNEATIRGSKEGFTESLRMNTTMGSK